MFNFAVKLRKHYLLQTCFVCLQKLVSKRYNYLRHDYFTSKLV